MTKRSPADEVSLRDVAASDLGVFFEDQRDPVANKMAAFPARERHAFAEHWAKILANDRVIKKTILWADQVAGYVVCFERAGKHQVGYWIGKSFWGKGVATRALSGFLEEIELRPLYAYVAKHNAGSIRVLEKCGFVRCGEGEAPYKIDGKTFREYEFKRTR